MLDMRGRSLAWLGHRHIGVSLPSLLPGFNSRRPHQHIRLIHGFSRKNAVLDNTLLFSLQIWFLGKVVMQVHCSMQLFLI